MRFHSAIHQCRCTARLHCCKRPQSLQRWNTHMNYRARVGLQHLLRFGSFPFKHWSRALAEYNARTQQTCNVIVSSTGTHLFVHSIASRTVNVLSSGHYRELWIYSLVGAQTRHCTRTRSRSRLATCSSCTCSLVEKCKDRMRQDIFAKHSSV